MDLVNFTIFYTHLLRFNYEVSKYSNTQPMIKKRRYFQSQTPSYLAELVNGSLPSMWAELISGSVKARGSRLVDSGGRGKRGHLCLHRNENAFATRPVERGRGASSGTAAETGPRPEERFLASFPRKLATRRATTPSTSGRYRKRETDRRDNAAGN